MKYLLKSNRALSISRKQHADDADMSENTTKATVVMMSRSFLSLLEREYDPFSSFLTDSYFLEGESFFFCFCFLL